MSSKITPFANLVYEVTKQIPKGQVTTYKLIAQALGKPNASRAVGSALSINPYAPTVPCHRVIASNGSIGGFFGTKNKLSINVKNKLKLLESEGVEFTNYTLKKSIAYRKKVMFIPTQCN
jgi:methylated-DNA-[protein]-cysteine S-methyltransferase